MKINSINFIKASDMPQRAVNTELQAVADAIGEKFPQVTADKPLALKVDKLGKYTRYALQKKLHKAGHGEARISVNLKENVIYVKRVVPAQPKKK